MVSTHRVRHPGRPAGWCDQRIQLEFVHHRVDALLARELPALRQRVEVSLIGERPFGLRLDKQVLPEVRHLLRFVALVKLDDFLQRVHGRLRPQLRQVRVQVGLQFNEQDVQFRIVQFAEAGDFHRIDQHRAFALHRFQRRIHQRVNRVAEAEQLAHHADAGAAQPLGIQKLRVIGSSARAAAGGRGILGVLARHRTEQGSGIGYGSRHRTGSVLAVRDRNDAGAAHQSERRLDANDPIRARRADNGTVRLRADRDGAEISRNRHARPRT